MENTFGIFSWPVARSTQMQSVKSATGVDGNAEGLGTGHWIRIALANCPTYRKQREIWDTLL